MKKCRICEEEKPESEFNKNARRKDGLQNECRVCDKALRKKYYESNREHYIEK